MYVVLIGACTDDFSDRGNNEALADEAEEEELTPR